MVRNHDGNAVPLSRYGVSLKLSTLLELYGVEYKPRRAIPPAPRQNDAAGILNHVLRGPSLAGRLHRVRDWFEREGRENRAGPSRNRSAQPTSAWRCPNR